MRLTIILFIALVSINKSFAFTDGESFRESCYHFSQAAKGRYVPDEKVPMASNCLSYLKGYRHAIDVQNMIVKDRGGKSYICIPEHVELEGLADYLVHFLTKNPEMKESNVPTIVAVAFIQQFDCSD